MYQKRNCDVCGNEYELNRTTKLYCSKYCRERKRRAMPLRKEQMRPWRRRSELKRKYGLSLERYAEMLMGQGGGCALCGQSSLPHKSLAVDHCHTTGRVRGILCDPCNRYVISNKTLDFFERCVEYMKEPNVAEA